MNFNRKMFKPKIKPSIQTPATSTTITSTPTPIPPITIPHTTTTITPTPTPIPQTTTTPTTTTITTTPTPISLPPPPPPTTTIPTTTTPTPTTITPTPTTAITTATTTTTITTTPTTHTTHTTSSNNNNSVICKTSLATLSDAYQSDHSSLSSVNSSQNDIESLFTNSKYSLNSNKDTNSLELGDYSSKNLEKENDEISIQNLEKETVEISNTNLENETIDESNSFLENETIETSTTNLENETIENLNTNLENETSRILDDSDSSSLGLNYNATNLLTSTNESNSIMDDTNYSVCSESVSSMSVSSQKDKSMSRSELLRLSRETDLESLTLAQVIKLSCMRQKNNNNNNNNIKSDYDESIYKPRSNIADNSDSSGTQTQSIPKVKIGVDGEIEVDIQSVYMSNDDKSNMDYVIENDNNSHQKYSRYKRTCTARIWSESETQLFYMSLRKYGTDFSIIEKEAFPNKRTRLEIKNKFKREEKIHPNRINNSLKIKI